VYKQPPIFFNFWTHISETNQARISTLVDMYRY